jgi:hypothetical protein
MAGKAVRFGNNCNHASNGRAAIGRVAQFGRNQIAPGGPAGDRRQLLPLPYDHETPPKDRVKPSYAASLAQCFLAASSDNDQGTTNVASIIKP